MKKLTIPVFLFFLLMLMGLGPLQGGSPEKIPVPSKKYAAVFVDQDDIQTECHQVSIEGATFIEGKRGEGTYTIPFENVESILFLLSGDKLVGRVKLLNGGNVDLTVNKSHKAYGSTTYGTFQIRLADLKKIIIRR
ncbi:MAG: hypothetical protein PHY31_09900 [Smithellaceae bacterium]|nr:hypothetical protein [Smithellaceae bacterium]